MYVMKKVLMVSYLIALFSIIITISVSGSAFELTGNEPSLINLAFMSPKEAAKLLTTEDTYTKHLTKFDLACLLNKPNGTKEELIQLISKQPLDWKEEEKAVLKEAAASLNQTSLKENYHLPLPREVRIIKSTMKEAGGAAGYTRGDYIVLSSDLLRQPASAIREVLAHELFHILTRNNPEFRKNMYRLIGFTVSSKNMPYPADLKDYIISNPDVDRNDNYATFTINGKPLKCYMILYSKKEYTNGPMFRYFNIGLVPLTDQLHPVQKNGKTVIYSTDDAADFYDKVGKNTNYILNPEEILAENFKFVLLGKKQGLTPELLSDLHNLLKE